MAHKHGKDFFAGVTAIIPAGGTGSRMGGARAKQFMEIGGKSILAMTLGHFQECDLVDRIVAVVPEQDVEYRRNEIVGRYGLGKVSLVVPGGQTRQDSVRKGLVALSGSTGLVIIHDGVRPLVKDDLIKRTIEAGREFRAVSTGLPVKDTVKEVNDKNMVARSLDRGTLWLVQTPQIFRYKDIYMAHKKALEGGWKEATDDASLVEKAGIPVKMIMGEEENIKITTPYDLKLARFLASK